MPGIGFTHVTIFELDDADVGAQAARTLDADDALRAAARVHPAHVTVAADVFALLSERGTPLYRKKPHCDIISDTYLVLQQRSAARLPFKQFRKIGATAIQRIGGDEARRLYKAGTIDSGDRVYVREAWEKLTPYLLAWGDELRQDGVLMLPIAATRALTVTPCRIKNGRGPAPDVRRLGRAV